MGGSGYSRGEEGHDLGLAQLEAQQLERVADLGVPAAHQTTNHLRPWAAAALPLREPVGSGQGSVGRGHQKE